MKRLTIEAEDELSRLTKRIKILQAARKAIDTRIDAAKDEVEKIFLEYDIPQISPVSRRFRADDGSTVRVTNPEPKISIDPAKFLAAVGPEIFLDVVEIVSVELKPSEWEKALAEERLIPEKNRSVNRKDLLNSIVTGNIPKTSVVVQ